MPRVVFFNRYFYPDHSATSQTLSDLAFFLAKADYEVCVVTSCRRFDDAVAVLPERERTSVAGELARLFPGERLRDDVVAWLRKHHPRLL